MKSPELKPIMLAIGRVAIGFQDLECNVWVLLCGIHGDIEKCSAMASALSFKRMCQAYAIRISHSRTSAGFPTLIEPTFQDEHPRNVGEMR